MEGIWPILFLAVVLKIPVFFGLWLVWWAARAYDELSEEQPPGAEDHGFRRWRRSPKPPRGPRRGPHGGTALAPPDCPPGGRKRAPQVKPRVSLGVAAHERR
ncbi:MAG: hypothetical protein FJW90_04000 [Actinobacteria bacterium]|nr:hypothetical protein [Actinomycetota bacterium]